MTLALVALASLLAAGLTFFTGFGLGTILPPVLAFFLSFELAVACAIDLTRLGVYAGLLQRSFNDPATDWSRRGPLLATAILAAFLGSTLGSRLLRHVTLDALRLVIGIALIPLAPALASGLV